MLAECAESTVAARIERGPGALAAGAGRLVRPSLERPVEAADVGEAEDERDLRDEKAALGQMPAGEVFADLADEIAVTRPLAGQPPLQRSRGHGERRGHRPGRGDLAARGLAHSPAHELSCRRPSRTR
jgi:hypothetical protein